MSARAKSLPLVGGALCLDFCNTTSGLGTNEVIEHLESIEDVAAWAVHAGVLPDCEARIMVKGAVKESREAALAEVLETRADIHDLLNRAARGGLPTSQGLRALNARLCHAFEGASLSVAGGRFSLGFTEPGPSVRSVLDPVLRSAAELLVRGDAMRLKRCPGRACGWLFYDGTKNANRVWCEMRVCGSRAKISSRKRREERDSAC